MGKEKTDEKSPYKHLLLSTKQEQYIIGRLEQIQNFTHIQLLEILYVLVDASQI